MRGRFPSAAALVLGIGLVAAIAARAQTAGSGGMSAPNASQMVKTPDITPDQRVFRDNAYQRDGERTRRPTKEQIVRDVSETLGTLQIPCKVGDARIVARGPVETNGKKIDTTTYEAACESGIGYFVVAADPGDAFSCFAAQDAHDKDVAAGREPGVLCALPANAQPKVMAAAILARNGVACDVAKVQWIGLSAKAGLEYTEVACADRSGYVLITAVPGSKAEPSVLPCSEAAKRGLFCKMSATGRPAVTVQTFRDALAKHKIVCTARDEDIRHIGQENVQKRHVVEFRCAEFPNGLVAFVPLSDSTAPFEVVDCIAAAMRGVKCTLR